LNNLGDRYAELGEPLRAIEFYEQVLAIAREIGDRRLEIYSLNSIGNALSNLKDHSQAENYYSQVLVLDPDNAMIHRNRADSLIRLGRLDEAETDCQASDRLAPNHPYTHARWGQLHFARGQYSLSVDCYQRAASLKPDDPTEFNFSSALPLLCLGRIDDAMQSIRARLAAHPHPSDIDEMIPEFEKLNQRYPDLSGLPEALELLRSATQPQE
ncbi:MAG TPA: tetratricopeptide repeat protein, partial [Anaerolineales bacterium]|nr:tetratricopeptide repeat protein [Anaerolineales bacterium]